VRRGFRLVTLDGRARVMAHVDIGGTVRVGRYGVDVAAIDELAVDALASRPDVQVYLVDEIGKMECRSPAFVAAMRTLLDSGRPVVATVGRLGEGFIAEVKRRPDAELWALTPANRDAMPARVVKWLRETAVGAAP
jgi:nucleoside-triphosphatase